MLWIVVCNFVLKECFDIAEAWYASKLNFELKVLIWYSYGMLWYGTGITCFSMVEVWYLLELYRYGTGMVQWYNGTLHGIVEL